MTHVTFRSGSEGPRHDPYHYDELTVKRPDGRTVTLHSGLATWADARWPNGMQQTTDVEPDAFSLFESMAGVPYVVAMRAYHGLPQRRIRSHRCGMKHFRWKNGYPGEQFLICGKCGEFADSTFDRSAVE